MCERLDVGREWMLVERESGCERRVWMLVERVDVGRVDQLHLKREPDFLGEGRPLEHLQTAAELP